MVHRYRRLLYFAPKHIAFGTLLVCLLMGLACAGVSKQVWDTAWWEDDREDTIKQSSASSGFSLTSQYLTMRDGVRIAIDLYLPKDLKPGQKLSTLLLQTRYWRRYEFRWLIENFQKPPEELLFFVNNGYAIVRLDVRGSGASSGSRPCPWSPDEIADGAQVVDWIISRPWSDGKVASAGGSYEGTCSEFLLVNQHPAVKAIAPMFALYDAYTDIAFPGGNHLTWFTSIWQHFNDIIDRNRISEAAWYASIFVRGVPPVDADHDRSLLKAAVLEHRNNYHVHDEARQLTFRDDVSPGGISPDSFSPHSHLEQIRQSGAVIYSYSGWFDGGYAHSAIKRFLTVGNPGDRLLLGPWDHGGDDQMCPFETTRKTHFDHPGEIKRYFDYHVKGIANGLENELPVHYYTMVENKWKTAKSWPPESVKTSFYLSADNGLTNNIPVEESSRDLHQFDLTATTGDKARWNSLAEDVAVIYPDRKKQDKKCLVYQSEPLKQDLEITGHPIATIYIQFDSNDGQLFAYLEDVDEKGRVNYITEGSLRALHRKLSKETPPYQTPTPYHSYLSQDALPLEPGEIAEMVFDLQPISYLLKKGHRIRLALAGADADHFRVLAQKPPNVSIYRDNAHPSRIELPVIN